ncbi:MAG: DUF4197 domain-containing protein [Paucibacter sp.]|nr:DUF4197 domain-containing protein [Roseateles sp.]
MRRRSLILGGGLLAAGASALALNETDAVSGIRAALERGAASAVSELGRTDGFMTNAKVHIELPGALQSAAKLAKAAGQGRKVEELELAMNRAAEAAVPQARQLLLNAVRDMSVEDGLKILHGEQDAATRFFEAKTREPLGRQFLPIVQQATRKVSLAEKYNAVAGKAAGFGLLKQEDSNIDVYVTAKALDGLFLMVAEEERKIRQDPVRTGSALLKKVFGSL